MINNPQTSALLRALAPILGAAAGPGGAMAAGALPGVNLGLGAGKPQAAPPKMAPPSPGPAAPPDQFEQMVQQVQQMANEPPVALPPFQPPAQEHVNPRGALYTALAGLLFKNLAQPASQGIMGTEALKQQDYTQKYQAAQDQFAAQQAAAQNANQERDRRLSALSTLANFQERFEAHKAQISYEHDKLTQSITQFYDKLDLTKYGIDQKWVQAKALEDLRFQDHLRIVGLQDADRMTIEQMRIGSQVQGYQVREWIAKLNGGQRQDALVVKADMDAQINSAKMLYAAVTNTVDPTQKAALAQQLAGIANTYQNDIQKLQQQGAPIDVPDVGSAFTQGSDLGAGPAPVQAPPPADMKPGTVEYFQSLDPAAQQQYLQSNKIPPDVKSYLSNLL